MNSKKELFIEKFKKSLGNVSVACKNVGICRLTYYNWLKKDEYFRNKIEEIQESNIDFVESKLFKKINEDDLGAIIFFLKTKGKNRGYSERYEMENKDVGKFTSENQIHIYLPQKEDE